MKLFAQICKVDEEKRLVFGRAAEEAVDKSDEIMDYMSSKPHFEKWSADVQADSSGKSLGNVRAMHGKVAAGKLTGIEFNDAEKAIDVIAKVVDDAEWKKVLEGVYTGFSIGGAYIGERKVEKRDGRDVTRYTARPSELSLVDRPCMPGAKFFEVQKADGSLAKVDFQPPEGDGSVVTGTPEEVDQLVKVMNDKGLNLADVIGLVEKGFPPPKADDKGGDPDKDGDAGSTGDGDSAPDAAAAAKAKAAAAADPAGGGPEAPARDQTPEEKAAADLAKPNKADDPGELKKLEASGGLEKMISSAIAAAVEPLQKALGEALGAHETLTKEIDAANAKITKLEAQPAPARVSLRAITKDDDGGSAPKKAEKIEPIVDDRGEEHAAAGLIKALHRTGGEPLTMRKA